MLPADKGAELTVSMVCCDCDISDTPFCPPLRRKHYSDFCDQFAESAEEVHT